MQFLDFGCFQLICTLLAFYLYFIHLFRAISTNTIETMTPGMFSLCNILVPFAPSDAQLSTREYLLYFETPFAPLLLDQFLRNEEYQHHLLFTQFLPTVSLIAE